MLHITQPNKITSKWLSLGALVSAIACIAGVLHAQQLHPDRASVSFGTQKRAEQDLMQIASSQRNFELTPNKPRGNLRNEEGPQFNPQIDSESLKPRNRQDKNKSPTKNSKKVNLQTEHRVADVRQTNQRQKFRAHKQDDRKTLKKHQGIRNDQGGLSAAGSISPPYVHMPSEDYYSHEDNDANHRREPTSIESPYSPETIDETADNEPAEYELDDREGIEQHPRYRRQHSRPTAEEVPYGYEAQPSREERAVVKEEIIYVDPKTGEPVPAPNAEQLEQEGVRIPEIVIEHHIDENDRHRNKQQNNPNRWQNIAKLMKEQVAKDRDMRNKINLEHLQQKQQQYVAQRSPAADYNHNYWRPRADEPKKSHDDELNLSRLIALTQLKLEEEREKAHSLVADLASSALEQQRQQRNLLLPATILTEVPESDIPTQLLQHLKDEYGVKVIATREKKGARLAINCSDSPIDNSLCEQIRQRTLAYATHQNQNQESGLTPALQRSYPQTTGRVNNSTDSYVIDILENGNLPQQNLTNNNNVSTFDNVGVNLELSPQPEIAQPNNYQPASSLAYEHEALRNQDLFRTTDQNNDNDQRELVNSNALPNNSTATTVDILYQPSSSTSSPLSYNHNSDTFAENTDVDNLNTQNSSKVQIVSNVKQSRQENAKARKSTSESQSTVTTELPQEKVTTTTVLPSNSQQKKQKQSQKKLSPSRSTKTSTTTKKPQDNSSINQ